MGEMACAVTAAVRWKQTFVYFIAHAYTRFSEYAVVSLSFIAFEINKF